MSDPSPDPPARPASLDLSRPLRISERAGWAEVGGEVVVYDDATNRTLVLNQTGALFWQCLDGTATIGEIALDMADAFGVGVDTVTAELEALAAQLADMGVLEAADGP